MLTTGGEGDRHLSKSLLLPLPPVAPSGARAFIDRKMGIDVGTAQSTLTVIFKLIISGLTSVILIVLGTVNLQFRGQFVPISLRSVLRIMAAHILGTVWSSGS